MVVMFEQRYRQSVLAYWVSQSVMWCVGYWSYETFDLVRPEMKYRLPGSSSIHSEDLVGCYVKQHERQPETAHWPMTKKFIDATVKSPLQEHKT